MNTTGQFKAERRLARENPVPEAATGSGRASGGSDSPLIGRERELRLLTELVRGYPGDKEEEMPYVKVGEENGRSIDVY